MMIARASVEGSRFSASSTGAALALLAVKQPAAAQGVSLQISARSLRFGLIPACTPEKVKPTGTLTGKTPSGTKDRPLRAPVGPHHPFEGDLLRRLEHLHEAFRPIELLQS